VTTASLIYHGTRIGVIWQHACACSWVITNGLRSGSLDGRAGTAPSLALAKEQLVGLMQRRGRIVRRRVCLRYSATTDATTGDGK
jgi:hypothetical protein